MTKKKTKQVSISIHQLLKRFAIATIKVTNEYWESDNNMMKMRWYSSSCIYFN